MIGYRHIIWDWNGTLLDDTQVCVDVLNTLCRQYRKSPTTYDQYRQKFDFPVERFYEFLGFDFTQESYHQVAEDYIALYTQQQRSCSLHQYAREALQQCQELQLSQSILSAYHQSLLKDIVEYFEIHSHFDEIMGLSDLHAKSKIAAGQTLLERLDCIPSEILFIGDTTHDHEVARSLQTDCILVPNGHQTAERLKACGVPVLDNLKQVPAWLKNVSQPSCNRCQSQHE